MHTVPVLCCQRITDSLLIAAAVSPVFILTVDDISGDAVGFSMDSKRRIVASRPSAEVMVCATFTGPL